MSVVRWAWLDLAGKAQPTTFETADLAIAEMMRRIGIAEEMTMGRAVLRIKEIGFTLALASVEVTPILALTEAPK